MVPVLKGRSKLFTNKTSTSPKIARVEGSKSLNMNRRIARETETTKYRIRQVEKTDENIYRFTRGSLRPQHT